MVLQTMYDGVINSPITSITNNISNTDTLIYVLDDTAIPDAPNILVIGGNLQSAETVLLTAKDGNMLTVERGFQGIAKTWNSGATISRNFTEYDYRILKENIEGINVDLDEHKDDYMSESLYITRAGDLGGVQVINTIGKPKKIDVKAFVNATQNKSLGSWAEIGQQQSMYVQGDSGVVYKGSVAIVIAPTTVVNMVGTIQNITANGFEILWTKTGIGVSEPIWLEIDILYHGGN